MATGKVKWFNAEKGFGFLTPDLAGQDVFVHISSLPKDDELNESDRVSYDIGDNRGRRCAINVKILR